MNVTKHVENLVLGGGEAGKYIAWELAQQGRPVVVIERALIGGACPNVACLPSKNVIRSAKVAELVRHASEYGVSGARATVDMEGVRRRKREMVDGMIAIHEKKFAAPNLEFLLSEGHVVGPRTVNARLPDGTQRCAVRAIFEEDGIDVVLGAETQRVEGRSGEHVRLRVKTPAGVKTFEGTDILVAAGRTPNTRDIGLEENGVELDPRGFIKVDEFLVTTAPGVWAVGECAGSPQFTHVAFDDFRVVRDNLAGKQRSARDRLVPYCAFIDPELARVGLDETMARQRGIEVRVARLPMTAVLRARAMGETRGFVKMLIDPKSDRILGFTMLGPEAGEVLAVVQTAMLGDLRYSTLRDAILTHPTMAEGLNVLLTTGFQ